MNEERWKEWRNAMQPGLVVQINPEHDPVFGGQFMTVTDVKSFGFMGYCKVLDDSGGLAFYRVAFANCEPVGFAHWRWSSEAEQDSAKSQSPNADQAESETSRKAE